jgi:hypothetical protein
MFINVLLAQNNVSEWSDMSTHGLLAQNNVSEGSDMSTHGLLAQIMCLSGATCLHMTVGPE